jgi:hypothetical protein
MFYTKPFNYIVQYDLADNPFDIRKTGSFTVDGQNFRKTAEFHVLAEVIMNYFLISEKIRSVGDFNASVSQVFFKIKGKNGKLYESFCKIAPCLC